MWRLSVSYLSAKGTRYSPTQPRERDLRKARPRTDAQDHPLSTTQLVEGSKSMADDHWMRHVHGHLEVDCQPGECQCRCGCGKPLGCVIFTRICAHCRIFAPDKHSHGLRNAPDPSPPSDQQPEPQQPDLFA